MPVRLPWFLRFHLVAVSAAFVGLAATVASAQPPTTPAAAAASRADAAAPVNAAQSGTAQPASPPSSPLAIHVGDADLLIGGFMDMTAIMRSTNTGNGIGTNFSAFPFTTTATGAPNPQGNLQETRFSAQNSRLTLQATSKVGTTNVKGYLEADFLGNTAQNLNVTSNSDGLRLRLYWAQITRNRFEFLAGQSWSFLTPNRTGLSPMPGDIMFSQDVDTNYQMGLTWGRTPQFRFIAHPNSTVSAGVSIENPQQYTGGAVVLPAGFNAPQVDTGSGGSVVGTSSPTPNRFPDVIGKVAFDPKTGGTHQHIDAAVLVSSFRTFNPANQATNDATGSGFSVNAVLEPVKPLHLIATNFYSKGGGRYIANTNLPNFIVNPDYSMTTVRSFSGIYGAEVQAAARSLLYGYYSLAHADQTLALDANGTTVIGYGVNGSQAANHTIHETTAGIVQTLFRDPKIGGMQLMVQYSHLQRTPFAVPAGTPEHATLNMVYVNVRYILP